MEKGGRHQRVEPPKETGRALAVSPVAVSPVAVSPVAVVARERMSLRDPTLLR